MAGAASASLATCGIGGIPACAGTNGAGNAQGLEWAAYPGVRSFGFSINAS